MSLSDTRKAIRELPDDQVWVSQFPIAELKELEAALAELYESEIVPIDEA